MSTQPVSKAAEEATDKSMADIDANREKMHAFLKETYVHPFTALGALLDAIGCMQDALARMGFDASNELRKFLGKEGE